MAPVQVGVVKETAPGERRVALTPDSVARLLGAGVEVLVESGAGDSAWYPDEDYAQVGATTVETSQLYERADVLLCVGRPPQDRLRRDRRSSACSSR